MLGQRRRRWNSNKTKLDPCLLGMLAVSALPWRAKRQYLRTLQVPSGAVECINADLYSLCTGYLMVTRAPTILNLYEWTGKIHFYFVSLKSEYQNEERIRELTVMWHFTGPTTPANTRSSANGGTMFARYYLLHQGATCKRLWQESKCRLHHSPGGLANSSLWNPVMPTMLLRMN